MSSPFVVSFDGRAQEWLAEHPSEDALVIAYEDTRC
jgi:hypothetical protein